MNIELTSSSHVEGWHPGIGEKDEVTLVRGEQRMTVCWGSVIAHTHGVVLDRLPGTVKLLESSLLKVGPKGYIHGWIKVGPPGVSQHDLWNSEHGKVSDLTDIEIKAAGDAWYGPHFQKTNGLVRSPAKLSKSKQRGQIEAYQKLIDRAPPLTEPVVLHRGTKDADFLFGKVGEKVGKTFNNKGIMSLSSDPDEVPKMYGSGSVMKDGKFLHTKSVVHVHMKAGQTVLRSDPRFFGNKADYDVLKEYTANPGKYRIIEDYEKQDGENSRENPFTRHIHLERIS